MSGFLTVFMLRYTFEQAYRMEQRHNPGEYGTYMAKVYIGPKKIVAYRTSPRIDLRTPKQKCTAYFCTYVENRLGNIPGFGLQGISDVYIESIDIEAGSKLEVSKAGFTECNGIYVFDPSALPPHSECHTLSQVVTGAAPGDTYSIGCMQGIYKHESNPDLFIGFENGSAIGYPEKNKVGYI